MQATEKGVEFGLNARAHARDHHGRQARQGELAIAGEGPRPKTYLLGQRGVEQKVSELGQQRLVVEYSSSYCLFINDLTNAILPVSHRVHKGYKLKLRALGHRVLDVAVAPTVGPKEFTAFFESALAEMPSIEIKLHSLQSNEDTSEVLSGKYHACIMPRETRPERKLDVHPLFRERFVLGCSANHPLAANEIVRGEDLLEFPFVDRLKCEFRDRILDHFARRDLLMRPRFRSDREDWVQRVVADGHAICILPERSPTVQGLVTRPIDGFVLEREVVIATVSGSTATVEIRNIAQLAARYEWN